MALVVLWYGVWGLGFGPVPVWLVVLGFSGVHSIIPNLEASGVFLWDLGLALGFRF